MREREKILCRLKAVKELPTHTILRRCFYDALEQFWVKIKDFVNDFPSKVEELEKLLTPNEIILSRTKDIAVLTLSKQLMH